MPRPVRVLLTSFEGFGGEAGNASQVMLAKFEESVAEQPLRTRDPLTSVELKTTVLPVVYAWAPEELHRAVAAFQPDVVIAFGQAPGPEFRLEAQAANLDSSSAPDNQGEVRDPGGPIVPGGPSSISTRLPLSGVQAALSQAHFPSRISESAGNFLCNHVFYRLLSSGAGPVAAGFIHVPQLPSSWASGTGSVSDYDSWGQWGAPALRVIVQETLFESL